MRIIPLDAGWLEPALDGHHKEPSLEELRGAVMAGGPAGTAAPSSPDRGIPR